MPDDDPDYEPDDEEILEVQCPLCGNVQPDMGRNVECEGCGEGPMPYYDRDGKLIEP